MSMKVMARSKKNLNSIYRQSGVFTLTSFGILFLLFLSVHLIQPTHVSADSTASKDIQTRTIVAELLEVEGEFYIARGERGEIRIEVNEETTISEEFTFGDRIKAIVLPNDVALSITRAEPNAPLGITDNSPPSTPKDTKQPQKAKTTTKKGTDKPSQPQVPSKIRVIIADLLMVDGSFYIVRTEKGEIQIEITPKTQLEEQFKFGDRIKARVTPTDKAISVVRAKKDEPAGIHSEAPTSNPEHQQAESDVSPPSLPSTKPSEVASGTPVQPSQKIRTIIANVLMVDGDFYIIRGERGEIQIEVTPKTDISETFDYGDKIKARVLPNDKALSIERAKPEDPIGIQTQ